MITIEMLKNVDITRLSPSEFNEHVKNVIDFKDENEKLNYLKSILDNENFIEEDPEMLLVHDVVQYNCKNNITEFLNIKEFKPYWDIIIGEYHATDEYKNK